MACGAAQSARAAATGVEVSLWEQRSLTRGFASTSGAPGAAKTRAEYDAEVSKLRKQFQEETQKRRAEEQEKKAAQEHVLAELRAQRKEVEAARRKESDAKFAAERAKWVEYMVRLKTAPSPTLHRLCCAHLSVRGELTECGFISSQTQQTQVRKERAERRELRELALQASPARIA